MRDKRVLIETFNSKFYTIGPGGYQLKLSPGSEVRDLVDSNAGHLMLPRSRFPKQPSSTRQQYVQQQGHGDDEEGTADYGGPIRSQE